MKTREHPYLQSSGFVTDLMIGVSDGIILPFALATVLSFMTSDSYIVLVACLFESLLLAAVFGIATYQTVVNQVEEYPGAEPDRLRRNFVSHLQLQHILAKLDLGPEILQRAFEEGENYKIRWSNMLSEMGLGRSEPDLAKAKKNALNVSLAFLLGACLPLLPFVFLADSSLAFPYSALVTLASLLIFGCLKAGYTGQSAWKVSLRLIVTALIVAGAAYLVAWLFR